MHIGVNPRLEKGGRRRPSRVRTVVSHSPGQASSLVARRKPDLPVPPRRGASPSHPLVGGDRRSSPIGPGRGSRRGITIVSLVCEDLAQNDDVAEVIRSVGPTIVSTALLDGPQLTSRWSARYASVLADDPGSAVMTLTSFGMAQRSRPAGLDASPVIALWKDPARGAREISLEPGAQGVLLTVCGLARPGAAPTVAGPSTTGPTTSTSPSTRSGPPAPARHQRPKLLLPDVDGAPGGCRRADGSHHLGRRGRRGAGRRSRARCRCLGRGAHGRSLADRGARGADPAAQPRDRLPGPLCPWGRTLGRPAGL